MIDRAVILVGRSTDCDAVIDISTKISRMHCVFVQVDSEYYVRDLASMNGVWVNGNRVEKSAKLVQGDQVAVGDIGFQFHANVQVPPKATIRTQGSGKGTPALIDDSVQILDAEIIEEADFVDEVQIVDEIDEIVEVVEVLDEVEIVDDVEIIEEIDIIDDVQIVDDQIRRPRRPPRLR